MKSDTHKKIEIILDHVYPDQYTVEEVVDAEVGLTILSVTITPAPTKETQDALAILLQQLIIDETVCVDIHRNILEEIARIKEDAYMYIQKALYYKAPVVLPPTNAFIRKIMHGFVAAQGTVRSVSAGVGRERHIIIEPL